MPYAIKPKTRKKWKLFSTLNNKDWRIIFLSQAISTTSWCFCLMHKIWTSRTIAELSLHGSTKNTLACDIVVLLSYAHIQVIRHVTSFLCRKVSLQQQNRYHNAVYSTYAHNHCASTTISNTLSRRLKTINQLRHCSVIARRWYSRKGLFVERLPHCSCSFENYHHNVVFLAYAHKKYLKQVAENSKRKSKILRKTN
jgi:hypothetical protein